MPEIERQQAQGKEVAFRGDAAFARPEIYEAHEVRQVKYAIRLPANANLERKIAKLRALFRSSKMWRSHVVYFSNWRSASRSAFRASSNVRSRPQESARRAKVKAEGPEIRNRAQRTRWSSATRKGSH